MMTAMRAVTLALTALVLIPGGAHLFELPGKIGLDRDAYFTVQTIYAGWALFGIPEGFSTWTAGRRMPPSGGGPR